VKDLIQMWIYISVCKREGQFGWKGEEREENVREVGKGEECVSQTDRGVVNCQWYWYSFTH